MENTLNNAHFFFDNEVHSWLYKKYDTINEDRFLKNCNFGYDLIDQPFYCAVSSDDDHVDVKLYIRGEMGILLDAPDLEISCSMTGEDPEVVVSSGRIGSNVAEVFMVFFKAIIVFGMQLEQKNLLEEFSNMDTEKEGVIVSLDDEKLVFERVNGKARPTMACNSIFGVQMARPYQDEIIEGWFSEETPLEEKIELAEDGDEDMMEQLALAYLNGDDEIEEDPEQAVYWFTKLAELDNSDAQFNMGLLYAKGIGVDRNFEKAIYWLEQASENGDDDAQDIIDKLEKAVEAEKIVSTGDAQAQADLAEVYMFIGTSLNQDDPNEDYAIAFDYAKKSADQNNGNGIWLLALCYDNGRGVEANKDTAIELYKHGAEIGHASSMHSLACYYLNGYVFEKNLKLGFELLLRSALLGNGLAMRETGRCYQFGNGCMGNMKKAVAWYKKALEIIDDYELASKTFALEMTLDMDSETDENYCGEDSDRELTTEEKEFIDKIDSALSDEIKSLIANPDSAIESYI